VTSLRDKVAREDYFHAAFDLLAEGGKAALTTTSVCQRLGVTTGSLYHHFGSGPGFYAAFIEYWETEISPALRTRADRAGSPRQRLDALSRIARHGNHEAEKAIRAWAITDQIVAAAQNRVDDTRHQHLTKALIDAGIPRGEPPPSHTSASPSSSEPSR
jgi:AcrR family transcriptional regulator